VLYKKLKQKGISNYENEKMKVTNLIFIGKIV